MISYESDVPNHRSFYFKLENAVNSTANFTITIFLANFKPEMSGYIFPGILSSNLKLFFTSDVPNYRNFFFNY